MKLNEEQKQTAIKVLEAFKEYSPTIDNKSDIESFRKLHNLNKTIEVGEYWLKTTGDIVLVLERFDCHGGTIRYKTIYESPSDGFSCISCFDRKATQEEIIEVLKKEGDKYIGKMVKCLDDSKDYIIERFDDLCKDNSLWYHTVCGTTLMLMKDGIWATVVEDVKVPKTIVIDNVEYILTKK